MQADKLTFASYRDYGDVISVRDDVKPVTANLGFAKRYNFIAKLENRRPDGATPNVCVFSCSPMMKAPETRFEVKLLERHLHSTQAFIPMNGVGRYLVIVSLGGDQPDLTTLKAFVATGKQGITYKPGVWHHPLVAMDQPSDFTCLVWEDGSEGDCDVVKLAAKVAVDLP